MLACWYVLWCGVVFVVSRCCEICNLYSEGLGMGGRGRGLCVLYVYTELGEGCLRT